jgi:transposase
MAKPRKSYTPAPSIPPEMAQRIETIMEVVAGRLSVVQAARTLGLSRNHFQTLLHRGMGALVDAVAPQQAGRPPKAREVTALEQENQRLRRENARLRETAETSERFLRAASGLLQGRIRPVRQARARKSTSATDDDGSEGEPRCARRLRQVEELRGLGVRASMAATLLGVHPSTVRRWKRCGSQDRSTAGALRARCVPAQAVERAARIVCELKGQVGADSLRRSVPQLSRRQAARIKAETLTRIERARKRGLVQVRVSVPGIVRGLDGMHVRCANAAVHALVSADAAVPYRTGVKVGPHYDAALVAAALERDIEAHGAPLVYRLDRAKAHDAPEVHEILAHHHILLLHGPPHCPRFYGQLERQNREHRAWADELGELPAEQVQERLEAIMQALNTLWRRRSLDWQTAAEAWDHRLILQVDRAALRDEVEERAARIRRQNRSDTADLAQRLAIEQALETRGYLRQTIGGWC